MAFSSHAFAPEATFRHCSMFCMVFACFAHGLQLKASSRAHCEGMSGGGGKDGKIQNDKWNKALAESSLAQGLRACLFAFRPQVLLKIDWADKVTVAQVDTRGKGYAPATRTCQTSRTSENR